MNRDLVDDSSPSAARDATDSGDEQEKPPLRAYIPSILVIVFGIVIVVGFFVTFHARASEVEDYWQERRGQQAEVVQRFEEQYGVSIDDPGSYSTDVSEWVIDGEARTCAVSDDTLPAPLDVALLCFNQPMVELERS